MSVIKSGNVVVLFDIRYMQTKVQIHNMLEVATKVHISVQTSVHIPKKKHTQLLIIQLK